MKILVATKNQKKLDEYKKLLYNYEIAGPKTEGIEWKGVKETGDYLKNAIRKMKSLMNRWNGMVLGEDSGLEIDALSGAPGPYSARMASTDSLRRKKILEKMKNIPWFKRTARFRCVIAFWDGKEEHHFEAVCEGLIALEERGNKGFGYDPIFIPLGFSKTFGELGETIKNRISHRALAVKKLKKFLKNRGVAQPG